MSRPASYAEVKNFITTYNVVCRLFGRRDGCFDVHLVKEDGRLLEVCFAPGFEHRRPWYIGDDQAAESRYEAGHLFIRDQQGFEMEFVDLADKGREIRNEAIAHYLNRIADELQPYEDRLRAAWTRVVGCDAADRESSTAQQLTLLRNFCRQTNEAVGARVPDVARVLGLSTSTLDSFSPYVRSRGKPQESFELMVWFSDEAPASFLRNVGKYRSFNQSQWRRLGWKGFDRPKSGVQQSPASMTEGAPS